MDKNLNNCKGFAVSGLEDGIYEVIVVEADERSDGVIAIDVAVSSGPHRGDVVSVLATGLSKSWVDLLASPGTLTVSEGRPALQLDD